MRVGLWSCGYGFWVLIGEHCRPPYRMVRMAPLRFTQNQHNVLKLSKNYNFI